MSWTPNPNFGAGAVSQAGKLTPLTNPNPSMQFWRDAGLIYANPPDLEYDFTTLQALPSEFNVSAPSLSSDGLYVSSAAQTPYLILSALISGFTQNDWTVEVAFALDQARNIASGRTPIEVSSGTTNRAEVSIGSSVEPASLQWANVSNPALVVQTATSKVGFGGYGKDVIHTITLGCTGGVGFSLLDGEQVGYAQAMQAQAAVPNLYLGGRQAGLGSGYIFGWIKRVRVWKTRISDARSTVFQPDPDYRRACWGDSLTAGSGATSALLAYPQQLATAGVYSTYNGGNGGDTSTQVKTRMLAAVTYMRRWTNVFWVGRNNPTVPATVVADVETMRKVLTHSRFLVLSVINKSDGTENAGSGIYNQIVAVNAALAAQYPNNYLDIRSLLVSYSGGANDAPASSITADGLHLTDAGYAYVAAQVNAWLAAKGW